MKLLLSILTFSISTTILAALSTDINCEMKLSPVGLGSVEKYLLDGRELTSTDQIGFQKFKVKSSHELLLQTTDGVEIKAIPRVYENENTTQLMVDVRAKEDGERTGFGSFSTRINSLMFKTGEFIALDGIYHVQNRISAYPSVKVICGKNL